jgi:hypothetical protein
MRTSWPGPRVWCGRHSLRVVELLGVPGAGKSTLAVGVSQALPGTLMLDDAVRRSIGRRGRDPVTRLAARLTRTSSARLWSAAYARSSDRFAALIRFASSRPGALESVLAAQRARVDRDLRPDMVLGWILNLMARYQLAIEDGAASWLVVDEGFAQRAVALLTAGYEQGDEPALHAYLEAAPEPEALIIVETPIEVCAARLDQRGWPERLTGAGETQRRSFLEAASEIVSAIDSVYAARGVDVVRIAGDDSPVNSVSRIAATLAS